MPPPRQSWLPCNPESLLKPDGALFAAAAAKGAPFLFCSAAENPYESRFFAKTVDIPPAGVYTKIVAH
jgi:hypothetical protein